MSEEITFDDIEFGEPIEEREPNYRDGYIRGIYRARNIIDSKQKEIERLNNIINGMEKFFQYAYDNEVRPLNDRKVSVWTICLDKLQELKGDKNNDNK